MERTQKVVVSAITATMAAMWLTGCSPSVDEAGADYAEICQDATGKRVDDDQCRLTASPMPSSSGHGRGVYAGSHGYVGPHWVYMPISSGGRVPAVGEHISSEARSSRPAGSTSTRVARGGGSYSKGGSSHGGFGGKSGGGS